MFKIPTWEQDSSEIKVNFEKRVKLKENAPESDKVIDDEESPRKRKHGTRNKKKGEDLDMDELENIILNTKKKKLNEALDIEGKEDSLFQENNNVNDKILSPKSKNKKKVNGLNNNVSNNKNSEDIPVKTDKEISVKKEGTENLVNNVKPNLKKNYDIKKARLAKMLEERNKLNGIKPGQENNSSKKKSNRNSYSVNGNKLRERMLEKLKAAQFRFLNEKLYTSSGSEAQQLFKSDPAAFKTYHQGYQQQLKKWPVNPLDIIVKKIKAMPKTHIIADMGCGEAKLATRVTQSVRSFDLVATAPGVEACDMAHTPLLAESVDVVVYCLALMGTQLTQYLMEANRVLKTGGKLLIAEVESRFDNPENFAKDVCRLGFNLKTLDKKHEVFFFMEFTKIRDPPAKKAKIPEITLKPCLYKRR